MRGGGSFNRITIDPRSGTDRESEFHLLIVGRIDPHDMDLCRHRIVADRPSVAPVVRVDERTRTRPLEQAERLKNRGDAIASAAIDGGRFARIGRARYDPPL